jgi:hypothetical protein
MRSLPVVSYAPGLELVIQHGQRHGCRPRRAAIKRLADDDIGVSLCRVGVDWRWQRSVAHVGLDYGEMTGTCRISGDVAQGPAPELAVLVCLPTIDIDRVIGETVDDVSHLEWAGYACAGRRVNLDDLVLVTSRNEENVFSKAT